MQRLITGMFVVVVYTGLCADHENAGYDPICFPSGRECNASRTIHDPPLIGTLILHLEGGGPSVVVVLTNAVSRLSPAPDARLEFHERRDAPDVRLNRTAWTSQYSLCRKPQIAK